MGKPHQRQKPRRPARAAVAQITGGRALLTAFEGAPSGATSLPRVYAVSALCTTTMLAFWLTWRWGYTSDHVLSGLMAKSVLERGERPIFVWDFGYQGILLEVYALALLFKIFGIGPKVLYSFSVLCFGVLLVLQARYNRLTSGPQAGLVSALLLGFGAPYFYRYVMRPQPNYTEIFIFGLSIMLVAQTLVQRHYVEGRPRDKSSIALSLAAGLLAGFGLYTYILMVFFLGAVALYGISLYLRDAWTDPRWRRPRRLWLGGVWALALTIWMYVCRLFFGGHLQAAATPQVAGGTEINWLRMGLMLVVAATSLDVFLRRAPLLVRGAPTMIAAAFGFLLGYAPQLHYTYWLHGTSRARTGRVAGTLLLAALLANNGIQLQRTLVRASRETFCGEAAIAALQARNIHYGIAWYWYAYAISFYTDEHIILDPIEDGYNPHYRQPVSQARRIAYMHPDSPQMRHFPPQITLWGRLYYKTDAWFGDGIAFVVLEAEG